MKKFGSAFGKLAASLGMLASVEAAAETNPALDQVQRTFDGVEDCGVYLREVVESSRAAGSPITRAEGADILADCRNAQLQATLAEQEATLAALDEQLAERGLRVEDGQLFNLEGDLLGYLIREGDQVRLDLSPWDNRNEALAAEAERAIADFEQFLSSSLANPS